MSDRRSWISESVLIIVSILAAFAIDAWWQERQEKQQEQRILAALKAEFESNAERLPWYIEFHRKSAEFGQRLLNELHEAGPQGSVSVPSVQLLYLISTPSADMQQGALDAILQSGELRFISDQEIRERLAGWPRLVVDATENAQLLRQVWNPKLHSALARRIDLAPVARVDEACIVKPEELNCRQDVIGLPYDTEVIGQMVPAQGYSAEAMRELGVLREGALEIVQLLDGALQRQGR